MVEGKVIRGGGNRMSANLVINIGDKRQNAEDCGRMRKIAEECRRMRQTEGKVICGGGESDLWWRE